MCPPCLECCEKVENYFSDNKEIRKIIIGFDGICNLSCEYCKHRNSKNKADSSISKFIDGSNYNDFFNALNEKEISNDAELIIESGELTLLPKREDLFRVAKRYQTTILTNATIYNEKILTLIARNGSQAIISVDAGLSETYKNKRIGCL